MRSFAEWGQGFTENDWDSEGLLRRREERDLGHTDFPAALRRPAEAKDGIFNERYLFV